MKKSNNALSLLIAVVVSFGLSCEHGDFDVGGSAGNDNTELENLIADENIEASELISKPEKSGAELGAIPLAEVPRIVMPYIDNVALLDRDKRLLAEQQSQGFLAPVQTTEPIHVDITPQEEGVWELLSDGSWLWRLTIESAGAYSIALGMSRYSLPEGAKLFVYSADYRSVRGPFTDKDNQDHGQLWLPLVPGDETVVELNVSAKKRSEVELQISSVNHDYKRWRLKHDSGEPPIFTEDSTACVDDYPTSCPAQRGCNVDVRCIGAGNDPWGDLNQNLPAGVDWAEVKKSAGQIDIANGVCNCSGTLLNNTAEDGRLLFITASHCFRYCESYRDVPFTVGLASVKVYWNYEHDTCRDYTNFDDETFNPNGATSEVTIGGANDLVEYRWNQDDRDFILLELNGSVLEYDVHFAGWDNSGTTPTTTVGIHHPTAQEKRISVDTDSATIDGNLIWAARSNGWENGIMQHGSSGSSLYDPSGRVVGGVLSTFDDNDYADNDCNDQHTELYHGGYPRISRVWGLAGTFLDPVGGATTLDGKNIEDLDCTVNLTGAVSSGSYDGCYIFVEDATIYETRNVSLTADRGIRIKQQTHIRNNSAFTASID